MHTLYF
jgi:hypothetical protein